MTGYRIISSIAGSLMLLSIILSFNAISEDRLIDASTVVCNWTFDEGEGRNAHNTIEGPDMILGNGNGTSPKWVEGIQGTALHYDGNDDVSIAQDIDFPSSAFTLSLWINTSWSVDGRVPLSYATIYESNEFVIEDPGDLVVHVRGLPKSTGVAFNDGKWHHLAITWSMTNGKLSVFLDGVEEYTGTVSMGSGIRSGGTMVLGNDQDEVGSLFDPVQAFNGTIDEIILIDHVLDPEMIPVIIEKDLPFPVVVSYGPEGEDVPVDGPVTISFNREMNSISVESAFNMEPPVNGTFRWDTNSLSFVPDKNLSYSTEYRVKLKMRSVDLHGRMLPESLEFTFKTEEYVPADDGDEGPFVTSGEDVDGDEDISRSRWNLILIMGGALLALLLLIGIFAFVSRGNEE